jgi:hypothetical protein
MSVPSVLLPMLMLVLLLMLLPVWEIPHRLNIRWCILASHLMDKKAQ